MFAVVIQKAKHLNVCIPGKILKSFGIFGPKLACPGLLERQATHTPLSHGLPPTGDPPATAGEAGKA